MNKNQKNSLIFIGITAIALFLAFQLFISSTVQALSCNNTYDCGRNGFIGGQYCQGNSLYQDYVTYSCSNAGTSYSSCSSSKNPQFVKTCAADERCERGLWYTGCVSTRDENQTTTTNNNPPPPQTTNQCQSHNYRSCVGSQVYWFDSCQNQQELYQVCSSNQICSNGVCQGYTEPAPVQNVCVPNTIKGCVYNSVFWYDSCGTREALYQNCSQSNQMCQDGACVPGEPLYTQGTYSPPQIVRVETRMDTLAVSIFGKKDSEILEWSKNIRVGDNDKINFLVTIKNVSDKSLENVIVVINLGENIAYGNDLKINDVTSSETTISEIPLGTIEKNISKALSFTGIAKAGEIETEVEVTSKVTSGTLSNEDFFTLTIDKKPEIVASATSQENQISTAAVNNNPFIGFLKKWYIWFLVSVVMIVLFIMIFRKVSSQV